jgi:hypothetical protein
MKAPLKEGERLLDWIAAGCPIEGNVELSTGSLRVALYVHTIAEGKEN